MLSKWHDGERGYVLKVGEEVSKERQVQNETGIVNENVVFYCTHNKTVMQSNIGKVLEAHKTTHTCGVPQRSAHSQQEMFELVSTLLPTHVNMAAHARAHTSQRTDGRQYFAVGYRTWRTSSDSNYVRSGEQVPEHTQSLLLVGWESSQSSWWSPYNWSPN